MCKTPTGQARIRKALLVELTGVTGVGKSTLTAALKDELASRGYRCLEAEEVILASLGLSALRSQVVRILLLDLLSVPSCVAYLGSAPGRRFFRAALRAILRDAGAPLATANLLRNLVRRIGTYVRLASLQREGVPCDFVLCDEGLLHLAHNAFVHARRAPRADEIEAFAAMAPKPDIAIWVTAPRQASLACVCAKGHPRVGASAQAAERFVAHAQQVFDLLFATEALAGRFLRVENPRSADDDGARQVRERATGLAGLLIRSLG